MVKTKRKKKSFAPFLHFNVRLSVTMSFGGQIVVHPIRCPLNENWRSNKCTAVIINYTQGLPFFVLNTHNKINLSSIDKRLRQKYILKSKYILYIQGMNMRNLYEKQLDMPCALIILKRKIFLHQFFNESQKVLVHFSIYPRYWKEMERTKDYKITR